MMEKNDRTTFNDGADANFLGRTTLSHVIEEEVDQWAEPAQSNEDLLKLIESLESLESTESGEEIGFKLNADPQQKKIDELRDEIKSSTSAFAYLNEFEEIVKNELLYIGSIPIERLQKEEQKIKQDCVTNQELHAAEQQRCIQRLIHLTEQAKERIFLELKQHQKLADIREESLNTKEKLIYEQLQKAFRQSENDLRHVLEKRKAEVKSFYGNLTFADSQYGGTKGRRWRVEWSKTPQPIQIKLRSLRGFRDKVPAGRYVFMVSLYDRLGGHVLRWSKLTSQQWGGATLPVFHNGHFSSFEMNIDQSVFTVLPPQWKVQPGMVLVFELFLLRGSVSPVDRVIAWGCFPICDGQFKIVQGQYKLPLLRGHMDSMITKHSTIEHLMASDIDHWIGNMYIQITRLPRYLSGQKEYEVELQFTSGLLSFPDRIVDAEKAVDGEKIPALGDVDQSDDGTSTSSMSLYRGKVDLLEQSSTPSKTISTNKQTHPFTSPHLRQSKVSTAKQPFSYSNKNKTEYSDVDSDDEVIPVPGHDGIFYKIHYKNPVEDYTNQKMQTTLVPKTPLLNRIVRKPNLTHIEELEQHTFSVQPPYSVAKKIHQSGHERAEYVGRMFLSEMGFSQYRTREFWVTILLLFLLWFLRLYVHYCGQWLFLQALLLPVSSFVFFPYTVDLNYQSDLLTTGEEIGVVVLGPISNITVQIFLVLISWLSQLVLGSFPLIFSKFILSFSIWVVLDPFVILIVDSILGHYIQSSSQPVGDAFKLYWHFLDTEGSGVVGIPLTIFLYFVVTFIAIVVLYLYFLKLHNNGRMLDVFFRLHGDEDSFFIPHDLELSNQELSYIVKKSEQWRGSDGERRKVTVYDYIWDEDSDELESCKNQEITTHIAIHTLHLDGLRELYRHFLRIPDGAIVEVFGELGSANLLPDVKTALLKRANNVENFFASTISLERNGVAASISPVSKKVTHKQTLNLPRDHKERPLTGDSMKTRETIRRDSSESSLDNHSTYALDQMQIIPQASYA